MRGGGKRNMRGARIRLRPRNPGDGEVILQCSIHIQRQKTRGECKGNKIEESEGQSEEGDKKRYSSQGGRTIKRRVRGDCSTIC